MKRLQIAVSAGLLLALGTAVAGSLIYGDESSAALSGPATADAAAAASAVSPETIELWKLTAASNDYVAPKVPI